MTSNPFQDRNLTEQLLFPNLSWSSYNAFVNYSKDLWLEQYVKGIRGPSNQAMEMGRRIGEELAVNPSYLPEVKRYDTMEKDLRAKLGDIQLIGHIDSFDSVNKHFGEYKTSLNRNKWTQEVAENHGQLLFYFLLIYLNYKIPPEKIKCHLYFIPCQENGSFSVDPTGEVLCFEVKKTMTDLLQFGVKLKKVYQEMLEFVEEKGYNNLNEKSTGSVLVGKKTIRRN